MSYMDALAVVEFCSCFSGQTGVAAISLAALQHAVVWPLDDSRLRELYVALLRYLLLQWVRGFRVRELYVALLRYLLLQWCGGGGLGVCGVCVGTPIAKNSC